ncbi:hypothetical protein [Bacillus sp. AFS017336]|uniref:hypothetical protein n=1 Tax=Bacillus sp. AFS017336 TaxID=2033489 RepID=UPI000BEFAA37|nr:hypothetical protein [Bacillus sp. AFS017336]PEL14261.1 hypothetical protein CN601_01570 [Bacillus sp. AFS017336]
MFAVFLVPCLPFLLIIGMSYALYVGYKLQKYERRVWIVGTISVVLICSYPEYQLLSLTFEIMKNLNK